MVERWPLLTRPRSSSRELPMKWQILVPLLALISSHGVLFMIAEQAPHDRAKARAPEDLVHSLPPKEPAEALRSLEVIDGFSVEFVAHEPLVSDPVAAAIDDNA